MQPSWGLGLILDRNLIMLLGVANLCFACAFALLSFKGRPVVDRIFITIGLFVTLTVLSLVGMHVFARTPIRDVQFFLVD